MKLLRQLIVVALLIAVLAAPVYAQEEVPTLPVDLTPIAAWMFLATLVLPPLCSLIKRYTPSWDKERQSAAILALCIAIAAVQAYINGSLQWANGDFKVAFGLLVVNIAIVVDIAYSFWYKMVWQALGFDDRIAGTK